MGLVLLAINTCSEAVTAYNQPVNPNGGLYQSSRWDPDGSDYDQYVWDDFTFQSTTSISEIGWVGAYDPAKFGSGGKVLDFTVAIYPSITAGSQPDVAHSALVEYHTNGNAHETAADSLAGLRYYAYSFVLPAPFIAADGTKYWIQIEAMQHGIPDWGIAAATGGDGAYFRRIANVSDIFYQIIQGDAAFSLVNQSVPVGAGNASSYKPRRTSPAAIFIVSHLLNNGVRADRIASVVSMLDLRGRTMPLPAAVRSTGLCNAIRLSQGAFVAKLSAEGR